MNKKIICYFSATGTTKNAASKLAFITKGDLFEIKPVKKYTAGDLNWNDKNSRTSLEREDKTIRPAIENKIDNIEKYDTVLIGFPIWWYEAPRIINTFIESTALENKKVYIFATSGGSSINESFETLKRTYPSINFISGKLLSNYINDNDIISWLV